MNCSKENDMSDRHWTELAIFLAVVAVILLAVFLSACATDDPERMRVQAEGTKAMHKAVHCQAALLNRAQPASAVEPC